MMRLLLIITAISVVILIWNVDHKLCTNGGESDGFDFVEGDLTFDG